MSLSCLLIPLVRPGCCTFLVGSVPCMHRARTAGKPELGQFVLFPVAQSALANSR